MKGAEPWSLCSLITVLIMLPGNNMHFIFFPSLCLYHLHPIPPLSPIPSPFHLFCLSLCFCFFFVIYSISYFLSCAILFSLSEFLIIFTLFFLFFIFRLSVVPDLCSSQSANEGKTHASHARELHYTSGPTRYTNMSAGSELQTAVHRKLCSWFFLLHLCFSIASFHMWLFK